MFVPLYCATCFQETSFQSCRQLCCIQTYVAFMAMVVRLWPMYWQPLGHWELVRKKYKFFPPTALTPHRPRESESMYVGPSYLCFQKFSRRCFCKLYFGKLWYKGHKKYVYIHVNLKLVMIIFTENFCNLLLLKIFLKTWAQYCCSHNWQSSPTIKAH